MPSEEYESGKVCQVFQQGWRVGKEEDGVVVRAAVVAVAL